MKMCPICHAGAFDDASICYGCLHRFEEGEGVVAPAKSGDAQSREGAIMVPRGGATANLGNAPALIISVQAVQGAQGGVEWRYDMDGCVAPGSPPAHAVDPASALSASSAR